MPEHGRLRLLYRLVQRSMGLEKRLWNYCYLAEIDFLHLLVFCVFFMSAIFSSVFFVVLFWIFNTTDNVVYIFFLYVYN